MKKYIVPAKRLTTKWKAILGDCFSDEETMNKSMEHFAALMTSLFLTSVAGGGRDKNPHIGILGESMDFANGLVEAGQITNDDADEAVEIVYLFVTSLVEFLGLVGALDEPSLIKFEGFVGMDVMISIVGRDEFEASNEECQSG